MFHMASHVAVRYTLRVKHTTDRSYGGYSMKVTNMRSTRGNAIPNQFIIEGGTYVDVMGTVHVGTMFQSYQSNIAFIDSETGITCLDSKYWDYSLTTGKYRNIFLGESKQETQRKIDSGEYFLTNLND
jgi:hypothetical protein